MLNFLLFVSTLIASSLTAPSGGGGGNGASTGPWKGNIVSYGPNADGLSLAQSYSFGSRSGNSKYYTLLSLEAWYLWSAANPTIGVIQLASTDPLCGGQILKCLVLEPQAPVKVFNGPTIQVSNKIKCGKATSCNSGSSVAVTTGSQVQWQGAAGVQIDLGTVKIPLQVAYSKNWQESVTSTTTQECGGSSGDTICLAYSASMINQNFGCTVRGFYKDSVSQNAAVHAWYCPSGNDVSLGTPVVNSAGNAVGTYSCITDDAACSGGEGSTIPASALTRVLLASKLKKLAQ